METIQTTTRILQADYGDCIFFSLTNGTKEYNILVDGGTDHTYYDFRNRRNPVGPLKELIDGLIAEERHIDLLVLTHVDDDHLLGIKAWFEDCFPSQNLVENFWINDDISIKNIESLNNDTSKASSLIQLLRKNAYKYENHIVQGRQFIVDDLCVIKVLAPSVIKHNAISEKIAKSLNNNAILPEEYKMPIKILINKPWENGSLSIENNSSIAIEIETIDHERYLLLGDASVKDIMKGIELFHKEDSLPICYKWIKLSHHGSKNNFIPSLLHMVCTETFIVSTNGKYYNHPDKDVIAYLIGKTKSNIFFNYPERCDLLFTKQDYIDYPDLNKRIVCEL